MSDSIDSPAADENGRDDTIDRLKKDEEDINSSRASMKDTEEDEGGGDDLFGAGDDDDDDDEEDQIVAKPVRQKRQVECVTMNFIIFSSA